jgi:hypothetical protein
MGTKMTSITDEMCECGRLAKSCRNKDGKIVCTCCATGISVEDLRILWSTPAPDSVLDFFGKKKDT